MRICENGNYWFLCFFQAEDGIRDIGVTGVQTCALPICSDRARFAPPLRRLLVRVRRSQRGHDPRGGSLQHGEALRFQGHEVLRRIRSGALVRSEERRVGKSVDLGGRRIIKKKKKLSTLL